MAKKTKLFDKMRKNILKKNEYAILDLTEPKIWASSGNYVLNHILSGKFGRGYPAGRITQLFGDSGCLVPDEKILVYKFKSKLNNSVSDPDNLRRLTDNEVLSELKEWETLEGEWSSIELRDKFKQHAYFNASFETIKDVYNTWEKENADYMIDTPDGFQYVSRFIHKDSRACFNVKTMNFRIRCSGDHLCETSVGWIKTENLKVGDWLETRAGLEQILFIEREKDSDVYDMNVEHKNHRYWGGNGISSHNSGKSYLLAKAISEAQKEGYMVAVLDSEQAISQDYLEKVGVDLDPSMLITVQVQTVEQTQDMLIEVLEDVRAEQVALGNTSDLKLMLIVDSLGMLTSGKALSNAESGHHAADMGTKAKALTNMFNQVVQKVGATETVCLMANHGSYQVGVMYPQLVPKGGQCLVSGTKIQTDQGFKSIENIKIGDKVRTHLDEFKPVERLFDFDNLDILEVELENGQIIKMTPEHKMLVERNGQKQWIEAQYLTTDDSLLELVDEITE